MRFTPLAKGFLQNENPMVKDPRIKSEDDVLGKTAVLRSRRFHFLKVAYRSKADFALRYSDFCLAAITRRKRAANSPPGGEG